MAVRGALLAALVGVGCLGEPAPFRCDLRGGDRACDAVTGAVCVEGYCAEPVSNALCASGFRYTASAATPRACASPRDASADVVDATAADAATDVPVVDVPVVDVPVMDVRVVDVPVMDVPITDVLDDAPVDAPDGSPSLDVLTRRDVVDDVARVDVTDAAVGADAPDGALPECVGGPRIVSPMPNERVFGNRINVRTERASSQTQLVFAEGLECQGEPALAGLEGGRSGFGVRAPTYFCLALQDAGTGGRACRTRWRHIAAVGHPALVGTNTPQGGIWPDFNGNGWADLLMATQEGLRVQSFYADGSFSQTGSPPAMSGAAVDLAAVGDVDGDGYGDAVISWDLATGRTVLLYRGGPSGLSSAPVTVTSRSPLNDSAFARQVVGLGDFTGDGRTEFGVLDLMGRAFAVWSVDEGLLRSITSLGVPSEIRAFAVGADLTGDGRSDVALSFNGQVRVFPGGGAAALDIVPTVPHGSFADVMSAAVDSDGDGVNELVVRNGVTNALSVYRYTAGGFVREVRLDSVSVTDAALLLGPGDMDGLRGDELVVLDAAGQVRVPRESPLSDLTGSFPWSPQAGVLLAGTSSNLRGRFWYARSRGVASHGLEILGLNGTNFTSQLADGLYPSAVRLVAR